MYKTRNEETSRDRHAKPRHALKATSHCNERGVVAGGEIKMGNKRRVERKVAQLCKIVLEPTGNEFLGGV